MHIFKLPLKLNSNIFAWPELAYINDNHVYDHKITMI